MLFEPEIMAKIEIHDGGRPPCCIFENLISEQRVTLVCRLFISVLNLVQKS